LNHCIKHLLAATIYKGGFKNKGGFKTTIPCLVSHSEDNSAYETKLCFVGLTGSAFVQYTHRAVNIKT